MPNQPCPVSITCEGVDDPIANYSSEALDQILFGATGFPRFPQDNPLGQDGHDPTLPPTWFAYSCLGVCFSTISQADADACARIETYLCGEGQRYPVDGHPIVPVFYNTPQQCEFRCPDGSFFVATIPAHTVVSGSQALADQIAHQMACEFAATHFLCLPDLNSGCADQPYSQQITMSAAGAPYSFAITAGALPPGLSLETVGTRLAIISGTPTTAGTFNFTLTVQDAGRNRVSKNYALSIVAITNNAALPGATVGTAYNETLVTAGGTAPYTYTLELGTLPDGLTLNSNGTITGTPTTAGSASFIVGVADTGTSFCTKNFTLAVASVTCPTQHTSGTVADSSLGISIYCNTTDILHPNKVFTGWFTTARFHIFDADTSTDYTTLLFPTFWDISSGVYVPSNQKLYLNVQDNGTLIYNLQIVNATTNAYGATLSSGANGDTYGYQNLNFDAVLGKVYMTTDNGNPAGTDLQQLDIGTNLFTSFVCTVNPGVGTEISRGVAFCPDNNRFYVCCYAAAANTSFLRGYTTAGVNVPAVTLNFFPETLTGCVYCSANQRIYLITENNFTNAMKVHVYNPATSSVETVINTGFTGALANRAYFWADKGLIVVPNNGQVIFIRVSDNTVLCSLAYGFILRAYSAGSGKLWTSGEISALLTTYS